MRTLLAIALATSACVAGATDEDDGGGTGAGKGDGPGSTLSATYISASSVVALREGNAKSKVAHLSPPFVQTFPNDAIDSWEYLKPIGCLGYFGPLGPYGPLGRGGPVGFRWYNPSSNIEAVGAAIEAYGAWVDAVRAWYDSLAQWGDLSWRMYSAYLETVSQQLRDWRYESKILSAEGPLSEKGPLSPDHWTGRYFMDSIGMRDAPPTDLMPHLGPGGVLSALGPVGPMGPLGPIGPLGPTTPLITFQGYQPDSNGQFLPGLNGCFRPANENERGANVCRTIVVPWKPQATECTKETLNCRRYELYENYSEEFARAMPDNDTSFMVAGTVEEAHEDAFEFRSHESQFVTVLVMPEEKPLIDGTALQGLLISAGYVPGNPLFTRKMKYMPEAMETYPGAWAAFYNHETAFDDFDLVVELLDEQGHVTGVARSHTGEHYGMPDWLQIKVPAGQRMRARVELYARRVGIIGNPEAFTLPEAHYRLFVTGSTKHAPAISTEGAQFTRLKSR